MKYSRANKGQFSVIAALLVSVILVTAVISAYTMVRHNSKQDSPEVLTVIGEMNTDIKQLLDFTVGYYGSILKVTGNSTYAKGLTTHYISSGLVNVAYSHPEWNPSFAFEFTDDDVATCWFMPESYSMGHISVTYSLNGLGIDGVKYETSSALTVAMLESEAGVAQINVTRDNSEPELGLTKDNFWFYVYDSEDSSWELVNPNEITIASNGVYTITLPSGVDPDSYSVQVEDDRGIIVSAFYSQSSVVTGIPHFTYNFNWTSTGVLDIYEALSTDTFVIEVLQNGTMNWLGQNLQLSTQTRPIPPVSVKAFRVNATINGVSHEVPFQVEDWASAYTVPLGLSSGESIFKKTKMLVFLVSNEVSAITLWWDGNDTAIQTSYAQDNFYFNDVPSSGILNNGLLKLTIHNFWVESTIVGDWSSSCTAEFLLINRDIDEGPSYGDEPSYVIYNGVVRDIIQQEAEYSGGISGCPNLYAHIVLTFPANATYYTYSLRTIFVDSVQSRTITDLSAIQLSVSLGSPLTEDGTIGNYPDTSSSTGSFSDGDVHHWSQFSSGTSGAGVMFTDTDNENLYLFDSIVGAETGALVVDYSSYPTVRSIEVNPVENDLHNPISGYTDSLDATWHGAVMAFDGATMYNIDDKVGFWVMVEHPPAVSMDEYEGGEEEPPTPPPEEPLLFYVGADASDVDSTPDKGSHSDFAAQQAGPDSTVDLLLEATEEHDSGVEDHVDNNTSNVDNSEDVGSHSSFLAQQAGPDSVYDTLTEGNTGLSGDVALIDAESFEGTLLPSGWSVTGGWYRTTSQHYSGSYSEGIDGTSGGSAGNLVTPDLDCSDTSSIVVDFMFYADGLDSGDVVLEYFNGVSWVTVADLGNYPTGWNHYQHEITDSQYFVSDFKVRWRAVNVGVDGWWIFTYPEHAYVDAVTITKEVYSTNYELDLEVQFTSVADLLPDHELCIYTGSLGTENLKVEYRSGSSWVNLAADLTENSWNNFTVPVSSSIFTVRFSGGNEVGDLSVDQWQIDTVLLYSHGSVSNEEAVDNNTSDVDSSPDKGSHSGFLAQQAGPDSVYDTLTEENTAGSGDSTLLDDGFEGWPWNNNWNNEPSNWQPDTSPVHGGSVSAWAPAYCYSTFTSDDLDTSDTTAIYIDFWFRKDDTESTDFTLYYYDGTGYDLIDELDNNGGDDAWLHFTATITDSQYFISNFRIRFDATLGNNENVWVDDVVITQEVSTGDNYELDQEVQWTDVPYTLPNEYLAIYGGTMGAEDLAVDVWTGSGWETVFTDLSSGWNNASISDWLTSSTFTIRFRGGTEVDDATLDTWQIDVALIHVWNEEEDNYELDLEVQWTGVEFDKANEELCIYVSEVGTETLGVEVWTGSSWTPLTTLHVGWNNVTINSHLDSSTFTIRFVGTNETGDTTPDYWTIDVTMLRCWAD